MVTVHEFPTHETAARAAKVAALAQAFQAHVDALDVDASPTVVAGLAVRAGGQLWDDLAEAHGIRRPSSTTIAATVRFLQIQAEQAGQDPFEGLS